jgi:arylsulfatase
VHDLAESHPEKLAELIELWWQEAERYQVLPLNNTPGLGGDRRYRKHRYDFFDGVGPIAEAAAPNLKNRAFAIACVLDVPESGDVTGALVAHGGSAGGYVLYVKDRRLHYTYNFVAAKVQTVSASVELPAGPVVARLVFQPGEGGIGRGGTAQLYYGDVPVGEGEIRRTTPITYGTPGFSVGFQSSSPIDPALPGRAEMPAGVLQRVVIEVHGRDPIREAIQDEGQAPAEPTRADLATQ